MMYGSFRIFFAGWFKRRSATRPAEIQPDEYIDRSPSMTVGQSMAFKDRLADLTTQTGIREITSMKTAWRNQKPCLVLTIPRNPVPAGAVENFRAAAQEILADTGLTVIVEKDTIGQVEEIARPRSSVAPVHSIAKFADRTKVRVA